MAALPGKEAPFLWIGTVLMFVGMVAFIILGWNEDDEKKREVYAITTFIPAIAFVSYLSMALGFGLIEVNVGGTTLDIYWARYADWLFTTPLLLIDLALLAGATRATIGVLVGADVLMILTGVIGAVTTSSSVLSGAAARIIWWGISCGFLVVILAVLVSRLSAAAKERSSGAQSTFNKLKWLILVLWTAYPIVWIIGTEGTLSVVPLQIETALFMVLDVTAKVGFGFVLLRSRSALDDMSTPSETPGGATPADD